MPSERNWSFAGRRNNSSIVLFTNPVNYEGEMKEVGAILALRYKKLPQKASFQSIRCKICNYVLSNYKDGGDLKPVFKKLEDPMNEYEKNHTPSI